MRVRIHPTAIVEESVTIGEGSSIWDNVHVRGPTTIGRDCIVGGKSYIAYDVTIGDRVKINSAVYIPAKVTIETGVLISAGTIFTNDMFPRATTPDLQHLRGSEPDEHTLGTVVREGATIGAGCRVGPGLEIGAFAMIGMGAVVTRDIPPFALALGVPARVTGLVCRCGQPVLRGNPETTPDQVLDCGACGRSYDMRGGRMTERFREAV
jgi:UDP-2-acetamido-3-amino-2,3-dideoxy-glucuronate N-acetyltransferase